MKNEKKKNKSQLAAVWRSLRRNRMAMLGLLILVLLALTAIFADFLAPYAYDAQDLLNARQAPSAAHIFGTDEFGRDIFSRIIYGSRLSLVVGFISVGIALLPSNYQLPWGDISAASVVATVPLIVLVLIFQKKIVAGLTSGGIKE